MKKLLTLAVLFLAGAAMADQNWVRVMVEPNWNLGDNSPGPGSGGMYTVYYAPTNGWGNTAEEILPKLKLYSPKEFDKNFTKLEAPAATYSRSDQQYTFTGYGATIDPTKAYFAVILCYDANYGYYYRVIDSHLSNYDQFLSGEPNEKCSAHLSFGYFYKIDIAYAFTTVTDEAGEETYISYMTEWDQGKLESAGDFKLGESRTYTTAELATAAAELINANPRKQIYIPTTLASEDEDTLTAYCNMFVATVSDKTVTVNPKFTLNGNRVDCASAEEAQAVALVINHNRREMIPIPGDLKNAEGVTEESLTAYCEMFEAAASGTRVVISFTPEARNAVQVSLTGALTTVFKAFVEQSSTVEVTNVVPGVYYAIKYGTDEDLGTKTTPILATGTSVTLAIPEGTKPNPAKFAFRVWASLTTDDVSSAGGVQLWEDGPYWAQSNVGANSEDEVGYYFWWGDTVGYKPKGGSMVGAMYLSNPTWVSSADETMSTSPFGSSTTARTHGMNNEQLQTEGYIDSTGNLAPVHDAATVHLGAPWRMPTSDEYSALTSNCDGEWTTRNGVAGLLLTGRGDYASKSVFLPVAGRGESRRVTAPTTGGYYWSSTPGSSSNDSTLLYFKSGSCQINDNYRWYGCLVRPLKDAVAFTSNVMKWSSEDGTECVSESQAQEIAAIVEANRSAAIAVPEGLSAEDGAAYRNMFGIAPIGTKVTIDLSSAAKQAIRASVEAAASLLFPAFSSSESTDEVQLTCAVPGIYYDIKYGVDDSFGATTPSVLAKGTQLSLTVPSDVVSTKFAFRVRASAKPLETCDATVVTDGIQLWEDGPYWSAGDLEDSLCSVGQYGAFCWWGDTEAYGRTLKRGQWNWYPTSGGSTPFTFAREETETDNKDVTALYGDGYIDSTGNLVDAHDVATVRLGASWRMPRDEEFQALRGNCTFTYTTMKYRGEDRQGWCVTGKGGKSIFLPASGEAITNGSDRAYGFDKRAHYWSSTVSSNSSTCARSLFLSSYTSETSGVVNAERWKGHSIRAVKDLVFASRVREWPLIPDQYEFATEAQAQTIAATINEDLRNSIAIPGALTNSTEEALSTYCNLYGATPSGTAVVIDLTPAATNDIQKTVDDAQTNVLEAVLGTDDKAKIIAIPGIYYAIEYGEDLGLGANTPGTMATGFTVDLDKPRLETPSAFFRVKASSKPIEAKSN